MKKILSVLLICLTGLCFAGGYDDEDLGSFRKSDTLLFIRLHDEIKKSFEEFYSNFERPYLDKIKECATIDNSLFHTYTEEYEYYTKYNYYLILTELDESHLYKWVLRTYTPTDWNGAWGVCKTEKTYITEEYELCSNESVKKEIESLPQTKENKGLWTERSELSSAEYPEQYPRIEKNIAESFYEEFYYDGVLKYIKYNDKFYKPIKDRFDSYYKETAKVITEEKEKYRELELRKQTLDLFGLE